MALTCLGIIDAVPAAQGSIWIRFYEMCPDAGTVPYRYDVHVKRADGGILTPAEINAIRTGVRRSSVSFLASDALEGRDGTWITP